MIKRENEIAKELRRLEVEALAIKSFRETGQFTLAIPGYYRMQWKPTTESAALVQASHAAWLAVDTEPLPLSVRLDGDKSEP